MKVHEYQAKAILSEYGIPVPKSGVASTHEEALQIAHDMLRPKSTREAGAWPEG
jgi:succinyl-CoA synthetase beta subunit